MLSGLLNFREQYFFDAIIQGDIPKVVSFIQGRQVSITAKTSSGSKQALHLACEAKQQLMVAKLLELGADVQAVTARGFTPLHVAVMQNDEGILIALIKAGAELNAVTDNGMGTTPLQEAAFKGNLTAVKILLAAGVNTQYRERKFNSTAADLAKKAGHYDVAVALLGYKQAFILRVKNILENWVKVFPKNTPQHDYYLALSNIAKDSNADDYFKELKINLEQDYPAIKEDEKNSLKSTLSTAMKQYKADKTLEHKVKSILNTRKKSALANAVLQGNYSQVEEALAKGEDVDQIVDTQGNTPLHVALRQGFYDIAKLLIIKGANILKENKYDESPMSLCPLPLINEVINESFKIRSFLNNQSKLNSLWCENYSQLEDKSRIKTLLEMNCKLEEKDTNGNTPLLKAAGDYKAFQFRIELLIRAGADTEAKNNLGNSLGDIISKLPIKKVGQKQKKIQAAIEEINSAKANKKLLILAVFEGLYNQVKVAILNHEVIDQFVNKNLDTPLIIALKNAYWHIARLLVENGASPHIKNKQGMSVIDIANQMKIPKIVTEAIFAANEKESNVNSQQVTKSEDHTKFQVDDHELIQGFFKPATLKSSHNKKCYWYIDTKNKKLFLSLEDPQNLLMHLSSVREKHPKKDINLFQSLEEAEKNLENKFREKTVSKGGICKGFIFEFNTSQEICIELFGSDKYEEIKSKIDSIRRYGRDSVYGMELEDSETTEKYTSNITIKNWLSME